LKVYVTAVPEDNKANKALLELLSKTFRIPKSRLHIIAGTTDRRKVFWFEGDDMLMRELMQILGTLGVRLENSPQR
jgi:uncharacterized protein YggU (UPF0235/DUF167 family)